VAYTYPYPRPALTADVVLFTLQARDLAVLLIRRKRDPFAGSWALPGGFVDENEALHVAAARELEEETGVRNVALEQLGAFGDPGRDPRGHTVSVAFVSFVVASSHRVKAGDDAADAAWMPLPQLALTGRASASKQPLAFDHARIVSVARRRLQAHLQFPGKSSPYDLVPARFTLAELHNVYEAILGRKLETRAFERYLKEHDRVEPVQAESSTKKGSRLYRWKANGSP
jgi:8-oxo-dGTP diphosphatase